MKYQHKKSVILNWMSFNVRPNDKFPVWGIVPTSLTRLSALSRLNDKYFNNTFRKGTRPLWA
jgi:hypothetical protein